MRENQFVHLGDSLPRKRSDRRRNQTGRTVGAVDYSRTVTGRHNQRFARIPVQIRHSRFIGQQNPA